MDLLKAIKERRTIREFLSRPISEDKIKKIINSANFAPSACDLQAWKFIVIKNKKIKQKVVDAGAASFILGAPVGVVVTYDNRTDNIEYQDHIQSASATIQNMILAAWSIGIGCCWVCHLPPKKQLRKIFGIPKSYDPIAYLALGYFDKKKVNVRKRKHPAEEIMSYNSFKFDVVKTSAVKLGLKRFFRKVYYVLPFRKIIKPIVDKKFEKKFD